MRILKLPLKLLALPLMLALYTLHIVGKLASHISAYVVGLFMLVVLICGVLQPGLQILDVGGIDAPGLIRPLCVLVQVVATPLEQNDQLAYLPGRHPRTAGKRRRTA